MAAQTFGVYISCHQLFLTLVFILSVDSVDLLKSDPYGPHIILSINGGKLIVVLQATAQGIIFRHLFSFSSRPSWTDFCEHGSWCFGLDISHTASPRIHVLNSMDGYYHGSIRVSVNGFVGSPTHLSVSSDLSTLIVYNNSSSLVQALDIDAYFLENAPHSSSGGVKCTKLSINEADSEVNTADEESELNPKTILTDTKRARNERMKYLRWYEEGDERLWTQNGAPLWKSGHSASGWAPHIPTYIPGQWITLSTSKHLKSIDWAFIAPAKIFVSGSPITGSGEIDSVICAIDRKDTSHVNSFDVMEPILAIPESSTAALYFIKENEICAFLPDQARVKSQAMGSLTSSLIIFDKPELAELLYRLNGWDRRYLKLQTLKLGLKYRQLNVIAPALKSLDDSENQQLQGAELLLDYTQQNRHVVVQDENFWAQLLQLSMEFVSSIMRAKSANIASNPSVYQEITKYAGILTSLRQTSLKLREMALKGSSAANTSSTDPSPIPTPHSSFKLHGASASSFASSLGVSPAVTRSEKLHVTGAASRAHTDSIPRRSVSSSIKFSSSLDVREQQGISPLTGQSVSPHAASGANSAVGSFLVGSTSGTDNMEFAHSAHSSGRPSMDVARPAEPERSQLAKRLASLEKKVDSSDEMTGSFGRLLQRWEKLRNMDIIADALLTGNLSTSLAYLQWRHNTVRPDDADYGMIVHSPSKGQGNPTDFPTEKGASILSYVISMACHLVYQAVATRKLEVARTIINNLGEDFDQHMKEIAWNTSSKDIRELLIPELRERGVFSTEEASTIDFSQTLEQAYPASSFRLSETLESPGNDLANTLKASNIPDYHIDSQLVSHLVSTHAELLATLDPSADGLENPRSAASKPVIVFRLNHLHHMLQSDPSMRLRLIFDAKLIQDPSALPQDVEDEINISEDGIGFTGLLAYFSSHSDWKRLTSWFTNQLDSSLAQVPGSMYGKLDENGNLKVLGNDAASTTVDALISAYRSEVSKKSMPESLESQIRGELAQRRIFVLDDSSSFLQLLRLLAQSSSLFEPKESFGSQSGSRKRQQQATVDISQLLPHGSIAPLHLFIIDQCVENKLVSLLSSYLNHYNLARTPESIQMIEQHLIDTFGSGSSNLTWATLLLYMRHEDTLFEASIANAQLVTRSKVSISVNSMISSNTIKKRPLMALGTLIYAPVSLQECSLAPKGALWQLEASQLSELCSAFPVLHESLFPSHSATASSIPVHLQNRASYLPGSQPRLSRSSSRIVRASTLDTGLISQNPASFDLMSSQGDINLQTLLTQTSKFTLTPFAHGPDAETNLLSLKLEDPQFDSSRFTDHADAAFFLCQGQPFKAYRWLLNHFCRPTPSRPSTASPAVNRPKPNISVAPNAIPLNEAPRIMRMVRQVAFEHVYDDSIIASCIALLELCDYKSLDLKVDCRSLVRLVDYCRNKPASVFSDFGLPVPPSSSNDPETPQAKLSRKEALRHLISLLESTYNTPINGSSSVLQSARENLVNISKMLEAATEEFARTAGNASSVHTPMNTIAASANVWSLLVFFNSVHKLPLPDSPLSGLAKTNDWVAFLYYAQVLGYPAELTLKLCHQYFSDVDLREHLLLCLNQMIPGSSSLATTIASFETGDMCNTSASGPEGSKSLSSCKPPLNQLFQAALAAGSNIYPGESLLQAAITQKRPLFSILALCFPDVTIVNCITVWLAVSVPKDALRSNTSSSAPIGSMIQDLQDFTSNIQVSTSTNASNRVSRLLKSTSASAFSSTPTSTNAAQVAKTHGLDSLYTLSRFFVILCAQTEVQYLIRALEVFEPSHLLLTFLRGLQAFFQGRYLDSAKLFSEIFAIIQATSAPSDSNSDLRMSSNINSSAPLMLLGDIAWTSSLILETCDLLIKWHMETTFERRELLKVLSGAYPSRFEALYREFCLLEKMELISAFTSDTEGFSVPSSREILAELVKRGQFDDARSYASFCSLNIHDVTIMEAEDLLRRLKAMVAQATRNGQRGRSGSLITGSAASSLTKGSSSTSTSSESAENALFAKERGAMWRQINALLVQRKCRPDVSGQFFLKHAQILDDIVTGGDGSSSSTNASEPTFNISSRFASAADSISGVLDANNKSLDEEDDFGLEEEDSDLLTIEQAATEEIQLLSLARNWFEGSKNDEVKMYPSEYVEDFVPAGGFDGNLNLWVPKEQLEFILAKILRLSVLAQAESSKSTSSSAQNSLSKKKPSSSSASNSSTSSSSSASKRRIAGSNLPHRIAKMDLSSVDLEVLETLIGKLLNQSDSPVEAEKTAQNLGIQSRELHVIKCMLEIATYARNGREAKTLLDKYELTQPGEQANRSLTMDFNTASAADGLLYVSRIAKHATECADRIIARYKAATHFKTEFDELVAKDPYEVLQYLILEGASVLPLAKHFTTALCLDKERIALMLAEMCYRAICDLDGNVSRLAMHPTAGSTIVRGSLDSIASPALTPSSSSSDLATMSTSSTNSALSIKHPRPNGGLAHSSSGTNLSSPLPMSSPQPLATFFSNKHWQDYVDLVSPRASLVGDEILRLLSTSISKPGFSTNASSGSNSSPFGSISGSSGPGNSSSVAYNVEIELIIRAFSCYRVGLDVLKQARLFELIEERVPIYVEARQFKSLVRLITGIKLYAQLQYILDILVKYDCFDMLLSRNVYHLEDGDDRKELQLALFNFLKANYASHIDKMKLLFLRFSMFREHADLLHERGWMILNSLGRRLEPAQLLQALDHFLEAAGLFAKDMAFGLEARCLDVANLIQLQFELPEVRIVNLKESQAQLFLVHCPVFSHSLVVAKAYSLLKQTHWVEPVFHQVIVSGNWNFWSELEAQLPLERGLLFSKIVKRAKAELGNIAPSNKTLYSTVLSNIRAFLEHLEDHYLRLKYARDLGISDMIDQLSKVLGAEYTTLIIS